MSDLRGYRLRQYPLVCDLVVIVKLRSVGRVGSAQGCFRRLDALRVGRLVDPSVLHRSKLIISAALFVNHALDGVRPTGRSGPG